MPIRLFSREFGFGSAFSNLVQDQHGFIWLSYRDYIQRFDGQYTKTYFKNRRIISLVSDLEGAIMVSTPDSVYRYNPAKDVFESIKGSKGAVLGYSKVEGLLAISPLGAARYDTLRDEFPGSKSSNLVKLKELNHDYLAIHEQIVFSVNQEGICRINLISGERECVNFSQIQRITALSENEIIVSTWETTAWYFNYATGSQTRISLDGSDPSMNVYDAVPSRDGTFYLASSKGLLKYDKENGDLSVVKLLLEGKTHTPQRFRSLLETDGNTIWAATENSLLYFNDGGADFYFVSANKEDPDKNFTSDVRNMAEDNLGNLWLATANGLTSWNRSSGVFNTIYADEKSTGGLNHASIRGLVYDGSNLIVGQTNKGMWIFNPETGRYRRPDYGKGELGERLRLKSEADFIDQIVSLRNGNHLICAQRGAYLLEGRSYALREIDLPKSAGQVKLAFEDEEGGVFLGTRNGLYQFNRALDFEKRVLENLPDQRIWTMMAHQDGHLIGTQSGLYFVQKGEVSPVTEVLRNKWIRTVFEDKRQRIWVITESEFFCLDSLKGSPSRYGFSEHVYGDFHHPNSLLLSENGMAYIGGTNGITYFTPELIESRETKLNTIVGNFLVPDKSPFPLPANVSHHFAYNHNNFEIVFNTPYFGNRRDINYRYRLHEDDTWHNSGNNPNVLLWNLAPGKYKLEVATSVENGPPQMSGVLLSFEIDHPFWFKWWFVALSFLILAVLVFKLVEKLKLKIRKQELLNVFATSLYGQSSVDGILWETAKSCVQKLGFVDTVIYLIDEKRNVLVQKAAFGLKNPQGREIINALEIPIGTGIVGTVALTGKPERIGNTVRDKRYISDVEPALSEITVPVFVDGRIYAIIDSEHPKRNFYRKYHLELLEEISKICSVRLTKYLSEEKIRSRIARDLHDEMGSTLSSIHIISNMAGRDSELPINLKSQMETISQRVSGMMEKMDDMVWVVNPANDSLKQLIYHIKEYAAEVFESVGIALVFRNNLVDHASMKLNAEQRKNVYLIAKEAMNNTMKYGNATQVEIDFLKAEENIVMKIRDNGAGFDLSETSLGNGLKNMKERASEINAGFRIISGRNGTAITLSLPFKEDAFTLNV